MRACVVAGSIGGTMNDNQEFKELQALPLSGELAFFVHGAEL